MKETKYTSEELELVEYVETDPASVPNVKERIAFMKNAVNEDLNTKKQVNFRINQNDLEKLKSKALVEGIHY